MLYSTENFEEWGDQNTHEGLTWQQKHDEIAAEILGDSAHDAVFWNQCGVVCFFIDRVILI